MASNAEFSIDADPFVNLGFDAVNAQVLTLALEDLPALDVFKTVWEVVQKTKGAPDIAELGAIGGGGAQPTPTPQDTLDITMPAAGTHSYIIRCTINNGVNQATGSVVASFTAERGIAIRNAAALRKIPPAETTQFDATYGWSDAFGEAVDATPAVPAVTVDNRVARFDGILGNVQNSGVTLDDADNLSGVTDIAAATATVAGLVGAGSANVTGATTTGSADVNGAATVSGDLTMDGATSALAFDNDTAGNDSTISKTQITGTGANPGDELQLVGQDGQAQTGATPNNAGGDIRLVYGGPGTGGSGAQGGRGQLVKQYGPAAGDSVTEFWETLTIMDNFSFNDFLGRTTIPIADGEVVWVEAVAGYRDNSDGRSKVSWRYESFERTGATVAPLGSSNMISTTAHSEFGTEPAVRILASSPDIALDLDTGDSTDITVDVFFRHWKKP